MSNPRISMIAAISKNRALGKGNKLLWHIPEDMKHFRETTRGHVVIMGRKTYESMGKALPNRINIIVTRDKEFKSDDSIIAYSLEEALAIGKEKEAEEVFIIGGGELYAQGLDYSDRIYLTIVHVQAEADTFFPDYKKFGRIISKRDSEDQTYKYSFLVLEKN